MQEGNQLRDINWQERADIAQKALNDFYWNEKTRLFENSYPYHQEKCDRFHYWWQAHAVDVLVDGLERTGNSAYKDRIAELYDGILEANQGVLPNDFYDDMEWMALAYLRAFGATGEVKYKSAALELWEDIKTGWNGLMGGGIAWRKPQLDYKNAPANGPAIILAARLYKSFGDKENLEWAQKIYRWLKENLVDGETGFVWDGMNRLGDASIDKDWKFTYCQGVFIGAAVELYRITGEAAYVEDAVQTAYTAQKELSCTQTGLLPSEGEGDGGLFKGIFVRYLTQLIVENPSLTQSAQWLMANGNFLWDLTVHQDHRIFGTSWTTQSEPIVDLSAHLSGVKLFEQLALLDAKIYSRN